MNISKKTSRLIPLLIVLFLAACGEKNTAESAIENMLDEMVDAVKDQDSQRLLSHFTTNAKIHFEASPALGGNMDMGVKDYGLLLELSWSLPAEYEYEVRELNIELADDNDQAKVTDKTYEKVSMQGKVVLSTLTEQTMHVVFLDGKPKIEELIGIITINNE